jgi:hypothetical protein
MKNGRVFSMLDEELGIYVDLNFKTYDLYFLNFFSKLVAAKNPAFF